MTTTHSAPLVGTRARRSTVTARRGRTHLRMALTLAAAAALMGCQSAVNQGNQGTGPGGEAAAACQPGGTLIAAAAQPPIPARVLAQGAANFFWVRAIFEPLVTVDSAKPTELTPLLASEYTIADDDKSVTLKLRDNVKFHSGRPFTSADVVFTIKQALTETSPSDVKTILSGWQVEATGDHEVTIRSENPLSPVLGSTLDLTPIVDSETYAGVEQGSQLVGTGPYKLDSYQPGAQITLTRNTDYWQQGQPVLDRIENVAIPDSTAQLSALRSGRAQLSFGLTIQDAQTITKEGGQFELFETGGTVYPLVLETRTGAFKDKTLRQAVGYAIDRERISRQVFGGLGKTPGLYWAAGIPGYPTDLENRYPYDPEKARQMIQQAGATGEAVPITFINNPVLRAEYEIIANNLSEVGLKPSPVPLAAPDYQQRLAQGTGGNYLSFRGQNGTAAFMVQTNADLRLKGAHRQFTTPEYTELVNQVIQASGDEQATTALKNLTEYMLDEAFMQVLVQAPGVAVKSSAVNNAVMGLGGLRPHETCLNR
jgi:peptide/nickel transport system substrate-binding protein